MRTCQNGEMQNKEDVEMSTCNNVKLSSQSVTSLILAHRTPDHTSYQSLNIQSRIIRLHTINSIL